MGQDLPVSTNASGPEKQLGGQMQTPVRAPAKGAQRNTVTRLGLSLKRGWSTAGRWERRSTGEWEAKVGYL